MVFSANYLALFPIVAIIVAVLVFNFLGDGLRDALDPPSTAERGARAFGKPCRSPLSTMKAAAWARLRSLSL